MQCCSAQHNPGPVSSAMKNLFIWVCVVYPLVVTGQWLSWHGGRQSLASFLTGSINAIHDQVAIARRFLRWSPPVSEPPPQLATLCKLTGLSCELHTVRTSDGFVLTLLRIPGAVAAAVPVLVLHGNVASSDSWLLRKDGSNLGEVLHRSGYDVWLANFRGSTHSMQHLTLNATDEQFWKWSFHEMGLFDVPAFVDHILAETGQQQLHVLAHSMGTAAILVTLSERPEYNKRVRFAGLMAPAVRVRGALKLFYDLLFYQFRDIALEYTRLVEMWNLAPRSPLIHFLADLFCVDSSPFVGFCHVGIALTLGMGHPNQRTQDYLATVAAYHPAGTSFQVLDHYGAINLSGRFRPLGSGLHDPTPPPDYNISAISAPVGLYHATNDITMDVEDVNSLGRSLPNLHEKHMVPLKQFNHLDFMWAKDVTSLLYDHVIQTMKHIDATL